MLNVLKYLMSNIFFHKILALGENFLSPTLNIIQPFIHSHQPDSLEMDFSNQPDNLYYPFNLF